MYSEDFRRLWDEIPKVITYRDYVKAANMIDSVRMDRFITEREEKVLLGCLDVYAKVSKIPTTEDEWRERYQ